MAEQAAHLVDHVLPHVPVRQWVLTLPHRLRYLLAYNHALCRAVLGVAARAVLGFYRRRARRTRDGRSGAVTVIQRFGGGLQLNVHFHTLLLDGVFAEGEDGSLEFHAAEPPSDEEVARLLATIYRRVQRLLARRGLDVDDTPDVDPLAEESPALAGISSASIQGRIALGPRAGARVYQLGRGPDAPWVTSRGPCQAPRGLRSAREHHGGGRRSCRSRAPVPLRAAPAGGAGASRTDARRTRPRHPEERVARRHEPPPLHAGRAPGEARCLDSPPTRQPRPVPRHPGTPCAGTGACRGARRRRPVSRRTPAHRRGRARPRPIPSGCRRLRHRPRREAGRREGGESSREAPRLEVGGLDAADFRSRRSGMPPLRRPHVRHRHDRGGRRAAQNPGPPRPSDRPARASAGPPPSLAARSLPRHPGLTRRLARPRPGCARPRRRLSPGVAPRLPRPRIFLTTALSASYMGSCPPPVWAPE